MLKNWPYLGLPQFERQLISAFRAKLVRESARNYGMDFE